MYDDLILRLRDAAKMSDVLAVLLPHSEGNATAKLYNEAADAIEELAAFKAQITDGRFYVYKLGTLFELKRDPRELVVRFQDPTEPPKEG